MLFSSAGLSHSPAKVFTVPGQQHLLGFTWIQLLEPQNDRINNKRKNLSGVFSDYFNKEKIQVQPTSRSKGRQV